MARTGPPGHGAEAGHIGQAEWLLVSAQDRRGPRARGAIWTSGVFSGLAETEGEAIRYEFVTRTDGKRHRALRAWRHPRGDLRDVLYEKESV